MQKSNISWEKSKNNNNTEQKQQKTVCVSHQNCRQPDAQMNRVVRQEREHTIKTHCEHVTFIL